MSSFRAGSQILARVFDGVAAIGGYTLSLTDRLGRFVVFAFSAVIAACTPPFFFSTWTSLFLEIGLFNIAIAGMTSLFAGMVLALQAYSGFGEDLAQRALPELIVLTITRELAPVLVGLMIAARSGSAIAAELGSMRVTEQIDALESLSADPWHYLIGPRVLACVIVLPFMVAIGGLIGVFGGYLVSVTALNLSGALFMQYAVQAVELVGVVSGLTKAAVFGLLIGVCGCYFGFYAHSGAAGVGDATTRAVMVTSILILTANYIITKFFFAA